jgi:hypothetical protein
MSDNAIGSTRVGKEIERASTKKRPIIARRIDTAPPTPNARTKNPCMAERAEPENPEGPDAKVVAVLSARYAAQKLRDIVILTTRG